MTVFTHTYRRTNGWLLMAGACSVISYLGMLPIAKTVQWLSSQPIVSTAFHDPRFAYQDALIFLFSLLFLTPLAGFIAVLGLLFLLAVLGGLFLPMARRLTLPEWFATALAVTVFGAALYVSSPVWLPSFLWLLGLVAKAYVIVTSS